MKQEGYPPEMLFVTYQKQELSWAAHVTVMKQPVQKTLW